VVRDERQRSKKNGCIQRESIDSCKNGQDSEVDLAECLLPESSIPLRGLFVDNFGVRMSLFQLIVRTLLFERTCVHCEREVRREEDELRGAEQRARGVEKSSQIRTLKRVPRSG
jgi:hypothetical protein